MGSSPVPPLQWTWFWNFIEEAARNLIGNFLRNFIDRRALLGRSLKKDENSSSAQIFGGDTLLILCWGKYVANNIVLFIPANSSWLR